MLKRDQIVSLAIQVPAIIVAVYVYRTVTSSKLNASLKKEGTEFFESAKRSIKHRALTVKPPSGIFSKFLSAVAFLSGAFVDLDGAFTNEKKLKGWSASLGQFNTFLNSTGVADEMEEAFQKPLLRGRYVLIQPLYYWF